MTGLLLLLVFSAWTWVAAVLTRIVVRDIAEDKRSNVGTALFLFLLVLPIIDELIGGIQYRYLCARASEFRMGVADPSGRVTRYSAFPSNQRLEWTLIPILHSHIRYTDVRSGESVVDFDEYVAKGGLFIRTLGISENNSPLTIGNPGCSPEEHRNENVRRTFNFSVVN